MANRVMQQKRLKMARMGRAWARPLAYRAGRNPNRIVINEYKERAKGLSLDEYAIDLAIATHLIKRGEPLVERRTPPGRIEALKRQGELEAILPDGCDLCVRGPGPSNDYQESFMYFNAKKTVWVVLYRDLKRRIERRSVTYSSKELLIMYWNMDKTAWVERRSIPVPPSS